MEGIIYICTTSVNGLIKIGKTSCDQFETRMNTLEANGYYNVTGLKRFFAILVDDYDRKEKLIHNIFSKSRVANSELFALNKDIAQEMLVAFDGKQVYPELEEEQLANEDEQQIDEEISSEDNQGTDNSKETYMPSWAKDLGWTPKSYKNYGRLGMAYNWGLSWPEYLRYQTVARKEKIKTNKYLAEVWGFTQCADKTIDKQIFIEHEDELMHASDIQEALDKYTK